MGTSEKEELLWEEGKLNVIERQSLELAGSGPGFDYIPTEEIAKALRLLDAHAADRAALVAQLEAAEKRRYDANQIAVELEDALEAAESRAETLGEENSRLSVTLLAQVAELQRDRESLVAQAALLLRERDEARADAETAWAASGENVVKVARLTEALAAAERRLQQVDEGRRAYAARAEAAEARVRELEAELARVNQ